MSSLGPIIPVFNAGRARLLTFDARAVDPTQIGFPELLAWIADREPRAIGNWRELSAQEYTRSFAVAQTAGYSVIREIYDALTMSFANGETAEEFAAGDEDAIAALARTLADETNPLFLEFGAAIRAGLEGVSSPEAARLALLNAFESLSAEKMAALAGLPLVFERMASEAGVER